MKSTMIAALLSIVSPVQAEQCRSLPALLAELQANVGEKIAAEATDERGLRVVFTASPGGSWTMIVVAPNKCAGIVASGDAWTHRRIPLPEVWLDFHPAHEEFDWIRNSKDPEVQRCCSEHDCSYQTEKAVEATGAGWYLHVSGEVIPFEDPRVKRSRDVRFVRCHQPNDKSKTRCLFVPPAGT